MTEIHHATHVLLAPATLAAPPRIEVGATARPRPVPSAHHGDGSLQCSTCTAIGGCATTGADLHPAQRVYHPYGHRRPAMSHSWLPAQGTTACGLHLRGVQRRMRSAAHVEASGRREAAPMLDRWVRARAHEHGIRHISLRLRAPSRRSPRFRLTSEERTPCT